MEKHIGRFVEKKEHVHHINGDRKDNRIENLVLLSAKEHYLKHKRKSGPFGRFATKDGSFSFYKRQSKLGCRGVHYDKQKNKYRVNIAGKHLGDFDNVKDAACCYDVAAIEKYGKYAILNKDTANYEETEIKRCLH
jgi:hypothetical protein